MQSCSLHQHSCFKPSSLEYLYKVKKKGLSLLESFCRYKELLKNICVSIYTCGFLVSGLLPKGLRPKDANMHSCM